MLPNASRVLALLLFAIPASLLSQEPDNAPVEQRADLIELEKVVSAVGKREKKEFLIHRDSKEYVYLGGRRLAELDYSLLLSVLRNNDLAAVEIDGIVNVVPAMGVRQLPLPTVNNDDEPLSDDEWVSRVIRVRNIPATQTVPILRPLMPRAGHLAALPPDQLLIVDRYGNSKRLTELVRQLDSSPQPVAAAD